MAEMAARLDHVGLAVADLEAAAAWFCDVFGLVPELSLRVDAIDLSIEMLDPPRVRLPRSSCCTVRGGMPMTWPGPRASLRTPAAAARREGYGHVAFDVADLDAAYDRAVARGARPVMPPCPAPEPGVRMAFVADPEGNLIELLHRPGRQQ